MLLPLSFLLACARPAADSGSSDTSEPPTYTWQAYDECQGLGGVVDGTQRRLVTDGDPLRRGALVVMRSDEDVHAYADGTGIYYEDIIGEGVDFTTQQLVAWDWPNTYSMHGRFIQEFRWADPGSTMTAVIKVDDPCGDEDQVDLVEVWGTPIIDVVSKCKDGRECTGRVE